MAVFNRQVLIASNGNWLTFHQFLQAPLGIVLPLDWSAEGSFQEEAVTEFN